MQGVGQVSVLNARLALDITSKRRLNDMRQAQGLDLQK